MGDFYSYVATVNVSKVEGWEADAILNFLDEVTIDGNFLVFNFEDCENHLWWVSERPSEHPPICQEEAKCLEDIMPNFMAKNALSLTFLDHWCSSMDEEDFRGDPLSNYTYEELAEKIPTLVLQEVFIKRLT